MKQIFLFSEKKLVFDAGTPTGPGGGAPTEQKAPETALPSVEQPKLPEAPKGPEVTEKLLDDTGKKTKEEAKGKLDGTLKKVDTLANIKVDEVKIPA